MTLHDVTLALPNCNGNVSLSIDQAIKEITDGLSDNEKQSLVAAVIVLGGNENCVLSLHCNVPVTYHDRWGSGIGSSNS